MSQQENPTGPEGSAPGPAAPPVAKQEPFERTHHGDTGVDPYEWLRDKESPDTLAYLEAENAWTRTRTAHLDELSDRIYGEIKSRTLETDLSVPYRMGEWWYYSRSEGGKQSGAGCRCRVQAPDDWTPPTLVADEPV